MLLVINTLLASMFFCLKLRFQLIKNKDKNVLYNNVWIKFAIYHFKVGFYLYTIVKILFMYPKGQCTNFFSFSSFLRKSVTRCPG